MGEIRDQMVMAMQMRNFSQRAHQGLLAACKIICADVWEIPSRDGRERNTEVSAKLGRAQIELVNGSIDIQCIEIPV